MTRVLEALAHHAQLTKDPAELAEKIRPDLGRAICDRFRDDQGRLHAIVIDPRLEQELRRAVHEKQLVLDPARLEAMLLRLAALSRQASMSGQDVAVLTDSNLRRPLRQAIARALSELVVIAAPEVPANLMLHPVAVLKSEDIAARPETPFMPELEQARPAGRNTTAVAA
jgi:flagellar biosynthesis component FlhA